MSRLAELSAQVVRNLSAGPRRLVLAESCTAGLVAASLGQIPGVSRYLCGSAVTYREATKIAWLRVAQETLQRESAVSEATTLEMATGVLRNTPEADLAVAVTGHLGPDAPPEQDGCVFVAVAYRTPAPGQKNACHRYVLATTGRRQRQEEAAELVLRQLAAE